MSNTKKKKIRRIKRREDNKRKEMVYKKEARKRGKLIEENHNGGPYSPEYTVELSASLLGLLEKGWKGAEGKPERFLEYYRQYSKKIKDLLLHWNPNLPKTPSIYYFLKRSIEIYWDTPNDLYSKIYAQSND